MTNETENVDSPTNEQDNVAQTPWEDLRAGALREYEAASVAAHSWSSVIPQAINFYFDHAKPASPPPTQAPPEGEWPPNRVWLPVGVVELAAVSPELENVEGAWWVRENAAPSGWQPIKTCPRDGTNFLACAPASSVFYAHWANGVVDSANWADEIGYAARYATVWQPLPPPPQKGK